MKPEAFITTMNDYRARIQFQLNEVRYPDGRVVPVMNTWKELAEELEHSAFFGEQFLKKSSYRNLVGTVLPQAASLGTQAEKARFFYEYLNKNVTWDEDFSIWASSQKLDEVFEQKKGRSSDLNLMLLVLLREAGITAYPLLTSTRNHGKMYEDYPILDQFNHMMVFAVTDSRPLLLDVTDPLLPPGYPNPAALNGRGWMMKQGGSSSWTDIKPPSDGADILTLEFDLTEDGHLAGWLKGAYRGYNAIPERRHYVEDASGVHWKERLAEKFPDVKIDSARFGNLAELEKPFFDTVFVNLPGAAQVSGEFLYLPPVLYSSFSENPFKLQERNFPVDIPYPVMEQYLLKVALPPGFVPEELPEPATYTLPNGGGSFRFAAEQKEGVIEVSARLQITQLKFTPDEYQGIKDLFDLMAEKCGEQIVLKKKD
jgi:hypothetical protein